MTERNAVNRIKCLRVRLAMYIRLPARVIVRAPSSTRLVQIASINTIDPKLSGKMMRLRVSLVEKWEILVGA